MAFNTVHDYLADYTLKSVQLQRLHAILKNDQDKVLDYLKTSENKDIVFGIKNTLDDQQRKQILQSTLDKKKQEYKLSNLEANCPFAFYTLLDHEVPDECLPKPGIQQLPLFYHPGRLITETEDVPITGYPPHPLLMHLLHEKYPQYLHVTTKYYRPIGTTLATFQDFNREQKSTSPPDPDRIDTVLKLVIKKLAATPYQPVHFLDVLMTKMPLGTGTGYHNRRSFQRNAHARLSHPPEYADKPTSKGYYINAAIEANRLLVHYIKYYGIPFEDPTVTSPPRPISKDILNQFDEKLEHFFNTFRTILFTRNHISKIEGPLKMRHVYAVDDLFLFIEAM